MKYIKLENNTLTNMTELLKRHFSVGERDTISCIECRSLAEKILLDLPTIEIVHCGECKCCRDGFIEEYMPLYIYCEKWNHETGFDDFCSAGERIEE